ncbi:MAG: substrate-binding domain-containing protein [Spirochaetes bacterium]|nr:substrate-binding domain-containing protein [Spirochaetota bacterium]
MKCFINRINVFQLYCKHTNKILVAILWMWIAFIFCSHKPFVILATTTSVYDSGLLDELIPIFEKEYGITVKTLAVGSGKALALGRHGEVDIILSHAPDEEEVFMKKGYGSRRFFLMKNQYYIVGPACDPAQIQHLVSILDAFRAIAQRRAVFISRGDNSGTHIQERRIWKTIGIVPDGESWYHETGLGMGETLSIASEKDAYTLTDRATWLVLKKRLSLEVLWKHSEFAIVYSLIEVNSNRFSQINAKGAALFTEFLLSQRAQCIIATYGKDTFGEALFAPVIALTCK